MCELFPWFFSTGFNYNHDECHSNQTILVSNSFYKQLAADVGFGLRFDFKILILRLDLGMPVRDPWVAENNGWVLNKVDFGSSDWRKNNLILNIAIGYPF